MIYDIEQKIAKALKDISDIEVHIEEIPQKVSLPCFLIKIYEMHYRQGLNKRLHNELNIDVMYFPFGNGNLQTECIELIEDFRRNFKIDDFKIKNNRASIVDGIAHLFFDVEYREFKESNNHKMGNMKNNNILKGE